MGLTDMGGEAFDLGKEIAGSCLTFHPFPTIFAEALQAAKAFCRDL